MRQRIEDVMKRHSLGELLEEEVQETNPDAWLPEGSLDHREPSMYARFYERHPELRPAKKEILKDTSPLISPGMTSLRYINETLLPKIKWLKKNSEDLAERLDAFEANAGECQNPSCKARGSLHIHENLGG